MKREFPSFTFLFAIRGLLFQFQSAYSIKNEFIPVNKTYISLSILFHLNLPKDYGHPNWLWNAVFSFYRHGLKYKGIILLGESVLKQVHPFLAPNDTIKDIL